MDFCGFVRICADLCVDSNAVANAVPSHGAPTGLPWASHRARTALPGPTGIVLVATGQPCMRSWRSRHFGICCRLPSPTPELVSLYPRCIPIDSSNTIEGPHTRAGRDNRQHRHIHGRCRHLMTTFRVQLIVCALPHEYNTKTYLNINIQYYDIINCADSIHIFCVSGELMCWVLEFVSNTCYQ